ncbi:MAG: tetratricopeptide repeat protein [Acidobacteriota bacterium]|nr:MAG: tetratricopeptide repeat protein [Acidobacteriota bacterium]
MSLLGFVIALLAGLVLGALVMSVASRSRASDRKRGPAERLVRAALSRLAVGDHRAASDALRQVAAVRSDDEAIYLLLGEALRRAGDLSRAERATAVLLTRRELPVEIASAGWLLRGRLLEARGQTDEALDAYRRAAQGGQDPEPFVAAGRLLSHSRRWPEAIEQAEALARLQPERGRLIAARRRLLLARERLAEGDASQALALAKKAVHDAPELAAARLTLGDAMIQLGRRSAAIQAWNEAACIAPALGALVVDRLEQISGPGAERERLARLASELLERAPADRSAWRLLTWLADEALRRGAIEEARSWVNRLEREAPRLATTARLAARLAAADDSLASATPLRHLLGEWERDRLWWDPWRCLRCGHALDEFEWRCPRCQAWESFG